MNLLFNWDNDALPSRSGVVFNDVWGHSQGGKEYAIVGILDSILFFDVTDPGGVVEVAAVAGGDRSLWRDMKSYNDYLYGVADQGGTAEGLLIIDMSFLPDSVHVVKQTTSFFLRAHNIFIDEGTGRLYVAGSNTRSNGVIVLDIATDPENPSQLSSVVLNGGYIHDLYARNDTIYCNHGNNGFYVYDMTNAGSPVELGSLTSYSEQGYNHACWLDDSGDNIVFTDETHDRGVKTVSVSDLNNIHVRDIFRSALLRPDDTASIAHNPIINGNRIYLSYYHDGIQIWDMTDPDSVTRLGYYDTEPGNTTYSGYKGAWGVYPLLPSGIILGTDVQNGLFVLEYAPSPLAYDEVRLTGAYTTDGIRLEIEMYGGDIDSDWRIERREGGVDWQLLDRCSSTEGFPVTALDSFPAAGWNAYRIKYRKAGTSRWGYSHVVQVYVPSEKPEGGVEVYRVGEAFYLTAEENLRGCTLRLIDMEGRVLDDKRFWFGPNTLQHVWRPAGRQGKKVCYLQICPEGRHCSGRLLVW